MHFFWSKNVFVAQHGTMFTRNKNNTNNICSTLQRLSRKKPFIFFSAVLVIYSIIQVLISYHIIETELGYYHQSNTQNRQNTHHHSLKDKKINFINAPNSNSINNNLINLMHKKNNNLFHNNNKINNNQNKNEYQYEYQGCDPIHISYPWSIKKFNNQKIACMILSLYPRNKILMQTIGETYGKLCNGLFFILDNSKNHWFNL